MKRLVIIMSLLATASGFSPTYLSFNTGQVSPLMEPRIDWAKYRSSARTVENMLVATQGPVIRRPGTKYIATQKDSTAIGRVISYEHSVDDSYVLLLEDQTMRFFREGGQILDSVGTENLGSIGNIIAHWLLNEDEGNVVADDDGNTHDGTLASSVDASLVAATGKVGTGSFDLDGQYNVAAGDHGDFTFSDGSDDSDFSLACWAYVTEKNDTQVLISKWQSAGDREWRFTLTADRKLQLQLGDTTASLAGRVAQWKLNDDAANQTVADAAGSHAGTTETDNTSVLSRDAGIIGKCFNFGAADAVEVADAAALSFGNGTLDGTFSIAAWVHVTDTALHQSILSKYDETTAALDREWRFYMNASEQLVFRVYDESADARQGVRSGAIGTGWRFVCATYDGDESDASGGMTLYVDGEAVSTTEQNVGTYVAMEAGGAGVAIAGSYMADGNLATYWADKMDNVLLFNTQLTAANVSSLYKDGEGTEDLGVAYARAWARSDDAVAIGWRFLVATYEPDDAGGTGGFEPTAANGIILYVDETAVASTATNDPTYTAMQNTAIALRVGAQLNTAGTSPEKYWADKMDEVSVYNDVLTSTEVGDLYSTTPYEIATPYLTADLFGLDFIKSEDVMYIAHADYEPRQLSRAGHTLWTLSALAVDDGPFQNENITTTTITPSATTGAITLTASAELFDAQHVNSLWRIDQVRDNSNVTGSFTANGTSLSTPNFTGDYGFTTTGTWVGTVTLQRSTDNGTSWRNALTPLVDTNFDNPAETESDTAVYRTVMSSYTTGTCTYAITITDNTNKGVVRVTGVTNGTSATALVLTDLASTDAVATWREGYWSDYRGWPETVAIHQQRLVFGGSATFPQTIWFGKTDPDDYTNFTEGTLDTSAFTVALAGNNPIQWMLSQDYLLIGNSGSCGKYGDPGKAVTPTSPNYQEQTRQGAASLPAIIAGDAILYVERGSRTIREFVFDFQVDKYLAPDLSVLSPEITESGIKDIAYQFRPYPILWCVLNNGDIATLTYQKNQSVVAWTKQITDGDFESVTVIPNTTEDEVWVTVKRTIDGVTETIVRYVEQFQPQDWGSDDNDAWFVDSGISYDGVATDTFTGANHLEGETVSIYSDLLIESPEVVSGGGFTIDNAASRVLVGMSYTSKLETMPIVIDPQDKAANKKIMSVWFDLYKSGYMEYGNGPDSTLINMNFNNNLDLDNTATAQDLVTSRVKLKRGAWGYGTMMKQTVFVQSDQPMPLTVRSITPSFNLFGN